MKGIRICHRLVLEMHLFNRTLFALALLWGTSISGRGIEETSAPQRFNVSEPIILFGDSTTASRGKIKVYGDHLREWLDQQGMNVPLINAGVPSNTTELARKRFQRDVLSRDPALVIIQFGINDSTVDVWKTPPASGPRVDLEEFKKNLLYFVEELQKKNAVVILMTPNKLCWTPQLTKLYGRPPYDPENQDGFNAQLRLYVEGVREIALATNVTLIDIYGSYAAKSHEEQSGMLSDGIHPNDQGHALVAELLIPEITRQITHPTQ